MTRLSLAAVVAALCLADCSAALPAPDKPAPDGVLALATECVMLLEPRLQDKDAATIEEYTKGRPVIKQWISSSGARSQRFLGLADQRGGHYGISQGAAR
jgi:hypothetical protein